MPRYIRHQNSPQMRLLTQQIPMPYRRIGIILRQQLLNHNDRQQIRPNAMNPKQIRPRTNIGHRKS